ncbi:hypothetical protein [Algoriphagus boritolerans]|uniref:hypothetical protein n=1 Tax=Algoriphagus boritolerans TaxID=308111 RepID=UPI00135B698E|nr:hypothetical protein [Algoriphagus boritolerans]
MFNISCPMSDENVESTSHYSIPDFRRKVKLLVLSYRRLQAELQIQLRFEKFSIPLPLSFQNCLVLLEAHRILSRKRKAKQHTNRTG